MTFPFVDRQIEPIPKVFASFLVGFLRQGPVGVPHLITWHTWFNFSIQIQAWDKVWWWGHILISFASVLSFAWRGFFTFKLALKGKSCVPFHLSSKGWFSKWLDLFHLWWHALLFSSISTSDFKKKFTSLVVSIALVVRYKVLLWY